MAYFAGANRPSRHYCRGLASALLTYSIPTENTVRRAARKREGNRLMAVEEVTTTLPVTEQSPVLVFQAPVLEPSLYINRELSLLDFQGRVLEEALDERNRLLERLK